jgi:hypothetical protein
MTEKLKVTNLTDKPSAKAKQHRMVDLKVFVGTKVLAPGESAEIENNPVALAFLSHLKNVEAISIEEVKGSPPPPPPIPTTPSPPPEVEEELTPEPEEEPEPEPVELEEETSLRIRRGRKSKKSRRG